MSKNGGTSTVYWFRKCLRLHDNPALLASVAGNCRDFRAVFVLDPWIPQNQRVGIHRWRFLIQSLHDLDNSLQNLGSRLFVIKGNPSEVFPKLFKEWNVSHLAFEVDTEPYSLKRDAEITKIAKENGVEVIQKVSHTLYDVEKIIAMNNGRPPLTYQRFLTIMADIGPPTKPSPNFTKDHLANCQTVIDDDHELKYGIPTFEDLGKDPVTAGPNLYPGGEKEAVKRMDHYLSNSVWVCKFSKPNSSPNSLDPSTTVLSPYLKFGCLSSRTFYYRLQDIYKKAKGVHTKPPVSLLGQLYWREFYYVAAAGTPNFDRMEGNPICKQIPWEYNKEHLEAWTNAKTGYPFIDAIMTQLRQEGWIHHLARHAVACFLTRGDLWVSWEEGQKVFEEFLLDADWALNAGNWMWLSASAFFHQYYRVYSPVAFGKKTDKSGEYIRKYLPILKKIPDEYIYEPWKAPLSMQQKANCVIGKDYPAPIVDHDEARAQNLKKMEAAYKANKNNGEEDDDGHNTEGEGESIITNTSPTKRKRKQESPSRIDSPLKKMTQKRIYEFKSK